MTRTTIDQERAEFEAMYSARGRFPANVRRMGDEYKLQHARQAWAIWQAATQSAADFYRQQGASKIAADAQDVARMNFIEREWFFVDWGGEISFNFNEIWTAGKHINLRAAIDAAMLAEKGNP